MLDVRHFYRAEMRGWWDAMSPRLLVVLDVMRSRWGRPIRVSPAQGAIGRRIQPHEPGYHSQHNPERWGDVRALDVMPEGMSDERSAREIIRVATECGATGIGLYPHWTPAAGLHIDVRIDRRVGAPALWSALSTERATAEQIRRGHVVGQQVYLGLADGYEEMS